MNSDGAGRAKGPAGLTAQGKKPICTCAQMLPYAVSPTDSSLQCTLSQEMHSWFWAWHPCSPIKYMLPVVSSCCLLTGPLHHLPRARDGEVQGVGEMEGRLVEGVRCRRRVGINGHGLINGSGPAYITFVLSNSGKITQLPSASSVSSSVK